MNPRNFDGEKIILTGRRRLKQELGEYFIISLFLISFSVNF